MAVAKYWQYPARSVNRKASSGSTPGGGAGGVSV